MRRFCRNCITFILLLVFCSGVFLQASAEDFSVKRIGNLIPFNDNLFSIMAPEKGKLTIKVHDDVSVYRTIEQEVSEGETTIHWDRKITALRLYLPGIPEKNTASVSTRLSNIRDNAFSICCLPLTMFHMQILTNGLLNSELFRRE